MIGIDQLRFSYRLGNFYLSIPRFTVTRTEKISVIGPSGSGKTTLLNLRSGIILPDRVPTANQMNELQRIRAEHPAQWFVWEGKPLDLSIEKLPAAGISSTVFDPCGNRSSSGDFMSVRRQNI